ncbi:class I SAM-dependent methyltransferase [Paenibacillus sp. FSL P2-0136]|uniref:class I SAM-dependent methyltransferase n=1 Tax=Paenibacillus sp. FSL P2-0136 TaxID=2975317 RepID=UPI0030DAC4D8
MDRITNIRVEEKKYHDQCYDTYDLFEPGSWLHKPVTTVINLINQYKDQEYISILDLGAGVGRNSIPIAESIKPRNGKVVCVDLLESAIAKLMSYSQQFGVEELDPMFEVNLSTERMIELLKRQFAGWEIEQLIVKSLAFEINRNGQPVKLTSDCITFVAKKS